jgi:hypothetical protein
MTARSLVRARQFTRATLIVACIDLLRQRAGKHPDLLAANSNAGADPAEPLSLRI